MVNFVFFVIVIIDVSCGVVNVMYDFFMLFGGMVFMVNILLGEVVFGGVGVGFYGMFVFVIFLVFIVGFMVGCMFEYFGKKIEVYDV